MSEAEEILVQKFLSAGRAETRTLADIIMDKLREKEEGAEFGEGGASIISFLRFLFILNPLFPHIYAALSMRRRLFVL